MTYVEIWSQAFAAMPRGTRTTYGEWLLMSGRTLSRWVSVSRLTPLPALIACSNPMDRITRFRWLDPERADDPRDVLKIFNSGGYGLVSLCHTPADPYSIHRLGLAF